MSFNYPRSGPSNTAEYMASGLPWVTSSTLTATPWRVDFPYVTSHIIVGATSGSVRLGFTQNGVNGVNGQNYFLVSGSFIDLPTRCKQIFLRSDGVSAAVTLFAGLTMINEREFPILTGSAIYHSASVRFELGYGYVGTPGSGSGLG
ncbi:MAG: hypothetical protein WC761_01205 [Candidatus Paceibacterota bacterium]|jgi:hypothetical protein